ncbi:hypothetical protein MSAN_01151400 [Mycena sanguinolenta]|uniref:Uncharacterized protein n=1 Tax=Mycena sanguinolenta TaxID=230812 RepID=A0A8H7D3U6_9AGAR|nr:hypothetical protein MSAN_01151400 [Mycena sanguinolenta]
MPARSLLYSTPAARVSVSAQPSIATTAGDEDDALNSTGCDMTLHCSVQMCVRQYTNSV